MIIKILIRNCFRLLAEYHSFLFVTYASKYTLETMQSFRLLAEYHSFLFLLLYSIYPASISLFPSPCGVSFILIGDNGVINWSMVCFRLLAEYHSFLFVCNNYKITV